MLDHFKAHQMIFSCPACQSQLKVIGKKIVCQNHHQFLVVKGIPLLFWSETDNTNQITQKVKKFYEQIPFPNYGGVETVNDIINKSNKNPFTVALNQQISFNIRVLEAGCGTGQLGNALGVAQRYVFGVDMSVNSLKLAAKFRQDNKLTRVGFYQMNLFKPIFKPESFSLIIANGVLHHTHNPYLAFASLAKLLKPKGYIMVGLYHSYGRLITDLRRQLFRLNDKRFRFLDPQLRGTTGSVKKQTWFLDQYQNPHESKHTFKEVEGWFAKQNLELINSVPKLEAFSSFSTKEKLFEKVPPPNFLDYLYANLSSIASGSKEGGLFIMIGRKKR